MNIYLLRHGETPANAARVVQTPDTPLSDRGVRQAERLAQRLRGEGVASILSSTLRRATMTAEHVSAAAGVPIVLRADLQERNYGDVRGLPYDEVGADILDPDFEPPAGETWREFHQRVEGVWRHLQKVIQDMPEHRRGNLMVVSHGLVLHSLVSRFLDTSAVSGMPLRFRNASVTVVEAQPPWRVTVLDCTRHLDADDCEESVAESSSNQDG